MFRHLRIWSLSLYEYVSAQAYNKKLLSNILPVHVAEFFMSGDKNNDVSNGTVQAHKPFQIHQKSILRGFSSLEKNAVICPQRAVLPIQTGT
jgi:hypothetical protein